MKILSWNVNGLRAISKKGFAEWLKSESPDILCLQETKVHPEQINLKAILPPEYTAYWNNPNRRGYAGVAVFTKEKPVKVEADFPAGPLDTEGRALILEYKNFLLINAYFPNGRMNETRLKYKFDFNKKFLQFLGKLKNKNVIICGDVNIAHKEIDLARPKQNEMFSGFLPEERKWVDDFISAGFVDTFREFNSEGENYTYWDYTTRARERNVGWRIDYFFTSKKLLPKVKNSFIMSKVEGSDHCPIGIEI